ncbi:MAG: GrpB family protein [Actinomycetota bacterium]|nr:GrpB family protein [Actinomycetota bacterium]
MDEEQLRAITVGELTPYATKVVIADYDPAWPDWFEHDRARISAALGPVALSIDHVGSTSVPGLPAKPVIDIVLQVADSADEETYVPALEAAGYRLRVREPEWYEHRLFYRRDQPPHDVNVHVFSPRYAAEEITRMLAFRDWLRANDQDRDLYAAAKRELSTRDWRYVQDYADAKSEVVQEILARALR